MTEAAPILDPEAIARSVVAKDNDTGADLHLSDDEVKQFVLGWTGKRDESLILRRELYTALQFEVESAVHTLLTDPLLYYTAQTSTPLYLKRHPRFNLVRQYQLETSNPKAYFVTTLAGNRKLAQRLIEDSSFTDENKAEAKRILESTAGNVLSVNHESDSIERSFMALPAIVEHFRPLVFTAAQMITPGEKTAGEIIFGDRANEWYFHALYQHNNNLGKGRDKQLLLDTLQEALKIAA